MREGGLVREEGTQHVVPQAYLRGSRGFGERGCRRRQRVGVRVLESDEEDGGGGGALLEECSEVGDQFLVVFIHI